MTKTNNNQKTENFFKIIRKFGNWQIEIDEASKSIKICNDYYSEWPTFVDKETLENPNVPGWSCDTPEILPNSIKKYLFKNQKKLHEIQEKLFELRWSK